MKLIATLTVLLMLTLPVLAFADLNPNVGPKFDEEPAGALLTAQGIFKAISNITDWIFSIFLVIAVIFILYGAYNLLISQGQPEALTAARKVVIYAGISVIVAVLAKSIVVVAAKIVGVDINF